MGSKKHSLPQMKLVDQFGDYEQKKDRPSVSRQNLLDAPNPYAGKHHTDGKIDLNVTNTTFHSNQTRATSNLVDLVGREEFSNEYSNKKDRYRKRKTKM